MIITATNPTDLDRALATARTPGDTIVARSGKFITRGNWSFPGFLSLAAGVKLDATGSTIAFAPNPETAANGVPRVARDLNILWAGPDSEVIGGTWDATPPDGWFGGGIRFFGKYRIAMATVTGLRGSWTFQCPGFVGVEVFGISSEGATDGSSIEFCNVKDVTPNAYVSGIYLGGTVAPAAATDGSRITGCQVDLGTVNQHAYSASFKTTITNSQGQGGRYGLYSDTGPMIVIGSTLTLQGSWAAVSCVGKAACQRNVFLSDCTLTGERGVEWWDQTPAAAAMSGGVVVSNSVIDAKYLASVVGKGASLAFAKNKIVQAVQLAVAAGSVNPMVIA